MFGEGIDTSDRKRKPGPGQIPANDVSTASGDTAHTNDLDKPDAVNTWRRLTDHYVREIERQSENRFEQSVDADFKDSIQWREEDAETLKQRGQVPLVYNVIAPTLNWVIGTEKRGRSDFKILPRRKEDGSPAEKKTALLKYLADCNRTGFHRSRAFADAITVGIGWLEDGLQEDDGEPIFSRAESWRNMMWDSSCIERDLSDARFVFRSKWVDEDIAMALAPDRKSIISEAILDGERFFIADSYGDLAMDFAENMRETGTFRTGDFVQRYQRRRLRVMEGWFTRPDQYYRLKGGPFDGELFDPYSAGHLEPLKNGNATVVKKTIMRMYCSLFTSKGLLYLGPSPYRHNRYPFTPIWAYRRDRDGMPYGIIRGLRGMQEDVNKRASKALHLISSKRVIMEEGAVQDIDELADEIARPDAIIVTRPGKQFKVEVDSELAQAHVELMSRDIQMIQQAAGVNDENMGKATSAVAGVAIQKRQDQGSIVTTELFDNLRFSTQVQGEKQLSLVEQFCDQAKQFRITGNRGNPDFVQVNDGLPENDIIRTKADFIVSDADWRASMRQAAADQLIDIMTKLPPQVGMVMLDLVIENMDLPNREEIVLRVRQLTGQRDPDTDHQPTPREQAMEQAYQEKVQLAKAMQIGEVRKTVAEAMAAEAKARNLEAGVVKDNIAAIGGPKRGAIDIAADIMTAPALAPAADAFLKEAGFEGGPTPVPAQQTQPPPIGARPGAAPGAQPGAPAGATQPAPVPGPGPAAPGINQGPQPSPQAPPGGGIPPGA